MRKGEQTRQRIIELAAPLFNQRGFEGCSMTNIMEATALEKGGIYRYFDSKESLAVEVLAFSLAESTKLRTEHLSEIPSGLARLRAAIERFVNAPSPIRGGCPLLNAAVDSDDGNARLRRLVKTALGNWRGRLTVMVEQAIKDGELRADIEPAAVVNTVIAALEGAQVMSRLDDTREPLEQTQSMLNALLTSLQPTAAGRTQPHAATTRRRG